MPRIPRLEKLFVKPNNQWSPFPKRPLPFRIPEWESGKYNRLAQVTKLKAPTMIPKITPYKEWPIIRGDLVEVLTGPDKGKQGIVRAVARRKNLVRVIGMNMSENFMPDMGDGKPGYMLNEEPIHYRDIKLVDPFTGKATDVLLKYDEIGNRVRTCKYSGRVIPKPPFQRSDFKSRTAVKEGDLDTKSDVVQQYTYVPSLLLFHEEIMKEMNIPMTVPKTESDRRDLIFQELERKGNEMKETQTLSNRDVDSKGSMLDKIKSVGRNIVFWKR